MAAGCGAETRAAPREDRRETVRGGVEKGWGLGWVFSG